jgi:hypothetical protein
MPVYHHRSPDCLNHRRVLSSVLLQVQRLLMLRQHTRDFVTFLTELPVPVFILTAVHGSRLLSKAQGGRYSGSLALTDIGLFYLVQVLLLPCKRCYVLSSRFS